MKDEHLIELQQEVKQLEKKDASYVAGFIAVLKVIIKSYEAAGTPLQIAFLEYLSKDVKQIYEVKSEHGKFKHVVK